MCLSCLCHLRGTTITYLGWSSIVLYIKWDHNPWVIVRNKWATVEYVKWQACRRHPMCIIFPLNEFKNMTKFSLFYTIFDTCTFIGIKQDIRSYLAIRSLTVIMQSPPSLLQLIMLFCSLNLKWGVIFCSGVHTLKCVRQVKYLTSRKRSINRY